MSYQFRNKARIRSKQNLLDVAIQEYGNAEAFFKLIDLNASNSFTIDSVLDSSVSKEIFADNQTGQEIDLVKKFNLEDKNIVNEDFGLVPVTTSESGFSIGFSSGF